MTRQMIRRFAVEGRLIESAFIQSRDTYRSLLLNMMREEGFVPLLDVNPVFTTNYLGGDKFEFSYTMQGVSVGKELAWRVDGMMDGKLIPSFHQNK